MHRGAVVMFLKILEKKKKLAIFEKIFNVTDASANKNYFSYSFWNVTCFKLKTKWNLSALKI